MAHLVARRRAARPPGAPLRLAAAAALALVLAAPASPVALRGPVLPAATVAPAARAESLPGRVVEVEAGEFFFRAPDTIAAGLTSFRLRQVGIARDRVNAGVTGRAAVADRGDPTRGAHMLWVVRLEQGKTIGDLHRAALGGERAPAWAVQLGGPSFAMPPRTSNVTLDLAPGSYALVCYVGSARADRARAHLLHGMFRALTVLPGDRRPAATLRPDVVARIGPGGAIELSGPVDAGTRLLRVENGGGEEYELKFHRVPDGTTGAEFLAQPRGEPGTPWGGLGSVPAGAVVHTTLRFDPGTYVVGTWPPIRHETSRVVSVAAPAARP